MTQTIDVIFDGMVLRPLEPLDLAPNTRLQISLVVAGSETTNFAESWQKPCSEGSDEKLDNGDEVQDLNQYISENYIYSDFYHSGK